MPRSAIRKHGVVGIQDRKLRHQFLGLSPRFGGFEQPAVRTAARNGGHELNDRLMREARGPVRDAAAQEAGCNPLFVRKPRIVTIHQDIGVNQRPGGHGRKALPWSSRATWREPSASRTGARAAVRSPRRTVEGAPLYPDPGRPLQQPGAPRESSRPLPRNEYRLRGRSRSAVLAISAPLPAIYWLPWPFH